jgi:hypothetical protein
VALTSTFHIINKAIFIIPKLPESIGPIASRVENCDLTGSNHYVASSTIL